MGLFKVLSSIPIVKTLVKITNNYVYDGDINASTKLAPLLCWIRSLGPPLAIATLLTAGTLYEFYQPCEIVFDLSLLSDVVKAPGEMLIDIFPSLLGFGIGVYALIFALSSKTLQVLQKHLDTEIRNETRKTGSALMLNASMGYPLIVLTVGLILAVFQKIFSGNIELLIATWFGFWYGMVVLIELVGVLFGLGEHDALDKLDLEDG